MAESTIVIPLEVSDKAALAELKKVQQALGAVGKESAAVNKAIADSMAKTAATYGKAFEDIAVKAKSAGKAWAEVNSALEVGKKIIGGIKEAIELANFSTEFERLSRAVPVERMRKLQEETQGTVSKFDLLKRAAKEMNLSATAGMDEQDLAFKRTLANWENYFNEAKRFLGGLVADTITWLDRLSDAIAGVDTRDKSRAMVARDNAIESANERYKAAHPDAATRGGRYGQADATETWRQTAEWRGYFQEGMDHATGRLASDDAPARKMNPWSRGQGYAPAVEAYKNRQGRGGGGPRNYQPGMFDALRYQGGQLGRGLDIGASGLGSLSGGLWSDERFTAGQFIAGANENQSSLASAGMGALGGLAEGGGDGRKGIKTSLSEWADKTKVLEGGFSALHSGISAAVEAAITGSDSIGQAFKKASGQVLKSLAIEATARAAFEGAMALGSLAILDFRGAAQHGLAAAQYGVAAVIAGGSAAALGGFSSAGGAGASGGGGGGNSLSPYGSGSVRDHTGGSSSGGSRAPINIYINDYVANNEAARVAMAQKIASELNKLQTTSTRTTSVRVNGAVVSR